MSYNVDHEVELLVRELKRIGKEQEDGTFKTTFGEIFNDDDVQQIFESLVGTLKAAKKRGIVDFKGEILLQGAHDNVEVALLKP